MFNYKLKNAFTFGSDLCRVMKLAAATTWKKKVWLVFWSFWEVMG